MNKAKIAGVWALQALLAVVMVGTGVQKFTVPAWERMFRVWGYPDHFYQVIGVIEVIAGIGLLIPKMAMPSAILLMPVMLGAGITRFTHGGGGVAEVVLLLLLTVIACGRRSAWMTRSSTRPGPVDGKRTAATS